MRILHHFRIALVALCTAFVLAATASAQTFPALTGRVVDDAGILDQSTRAALTAKLAALEAQNTDQLVVATVSSLQGNAIESYATQLFRTWRLGRKDTNNGVLLLVAPAERKVRIEVGYGLEGTLTDAVARLIIEQSIVPRFRAGDFAGGIVRATDDIVRVLTGDAPTWQRRAAAAAPPAQPAPTAGGTELPGWVEKLLITLFLLLFFIVAGLFVLPLLVVLAALLVWLGVLPKQKDRHGAWLWLNYLNRDPEPDRQPLGAHSRRSSGSSDSSWSSSSSSDSSSDSFSGGGGSSGGGGASGSW
jgi:uncharacterized protein